MATDGKHMPFDELPENLREDIFLLLDSADLNACLQVSQSWKDFVEREILFSERNRSQAAVAKHRKEYSKVVADKEIAVDAGFMAVSYDCAEDILYTLCMPTKGFNWNGDPWLLKQYDCRDGLRELKSVFLQTSRFLKRMEVVAGHLVIFLQPTGDGNNAPAVFSLASIPWDDRMTIEDGISLPGAGFHFSKLLLSENCLFVVSKNAHVTLTSANGGTANESTHPEFAMEKDRPIVVQRITMKSGIWHDAGQIIPKHPFKIMETFSLIPSKDINEKYKEQTCLLYLNDSIITERLILVSCPLHGSYEMYDFVNDNSVWHMNVALLPFENIHSILKEAQNRTSVLAAIRDAYVFVLTEPDAATLVSVKDGQRLGQLKGDRLVLGSRHVQPVDDRLLPRGRKGKFLFDRKWESPLGFGHVMLNSNALVFWKRQSVDSFTLNLGRIQFDQKK